MSKHFIKIIALTDEVFYKGLGSMHLCDEVGLSFHLPVDELNLISAVPLEEITARFLQQIVDAKIG